MDEKNQKNKSFFVALLVVLFLLLQPIDRICHNNRMIDAEAGEARQKKSPSVVNFVREASPLFGKTYQELASKYNLQDYEPIKDGSSYKTKNTMFSINDYCSEFIFYFVRDQLYNITCIAADKQIASDGIKEVSRDSNFKRKRGVLPPSTEIWHFSNKKLEISLLGEQGTIAILNTPY